MCEEDAVKIGVIGAGLQGEKHIECFQYFHNSQVVAIADVDGEKAAKRARQHGVPLHYDDYNKMLADADLDAVVVAIPDHLHFEPAMAVIGAKKHLLIEKPLAMSVAEAEKIVAAAKNAGVKMMVNMSNRFQVSLQQTKTRFDNGELGKPVYAYTRLNNTLYVPLQMLKSWAKFTRLPFWLLSHTVDRVRWIWGLEARRVYAASHEGILKDKGVDTPDLYVATVEFDNGAIGVFETCWTLPETSPMIVDSYMELIFSEACVKIDAQATGITIADAERYTFGTTLTGKAMGHPVGFVAESLKHFADCVAEDREPMITGDDGLAVVKVTAAICESAEKRIPVEIA